MSSHKILVKPYYSRFSPMKGLNHFSRFFLRFRYPGALPEDIAKALGVQISNFLTFNEFVNVITSPNLHPTRLSRYMPRCRAEEAFSRAQKKECFGRCSLFSYYFSEGWMEFQLQFDAESRLRRIYVQHKQIDHDRGIEIPLETL